MPCSCGGKVPSLTNLGSGGEFRGKEKVTAIQLEEIERMGENLWKDGQLIKCCLGRSIIIGAKREIFVQLPFVVKNVQVNISSCCCIKNLMIESVWKDSNKPLRCRLYNNGDVPLQIGSRCAIIAIWCGQKEVILKRLNGQEVKIEEKRINVKNIQEIKIREEKWEKEFSDVISSKIPGVKHYQIDDIKLRENVDVSKVKVRQFARIEAEKLRPLVKEFLDLGAIEEVEKRPRLVTPMLTVPKKEGGLRLVLDFRMLNEMTKPIQSDPIDRNKILNSVKKCGVWTTLDLTKGFLQVPIAKEFRTWFGLELEGKWYQFKRCPFGWNNSMAYLAQALNITLVKIREKMDKDVVLLNYVDDILLGTKSIASHDKAVKTLLEGLRKHGWTISPTKIKWYKENVEFLGRSFSVSGIKPTEGLINKVDQLKKPECSQDLRGFFGLALHFAPFSFRLSKILNELAQWKRKDIKDFKGKRFDEVWQEAKKNLKTCWFELKYAEGGGSWKILVDASSKGMGAILLEKEKPVAMFSKEVKKSWLHSTELEIEAVVQAAEAFDPWIRGDKVEILTDNWATYRALEATNVGAYVLRRLDKLLQWNAKLKFIAGKEQILADWLSRNKYWMRCGIREFKLNQINGCWEEDFVKQVHNGWHAGKEVTRKLFVKRFGNQPKKGLIEKVVDECAICQRWKKLQKKEELRFIPARRSFGTIGIDFIGPLKKGPDGIRFCFIIVDYITRWMDIWPMKGATTMDAIWGIKSWIAERGKPDIVVADYGPAFRSERFWEYCKSMNIELRLAAAFNHQANGMVERAIGTVLKKISKLSFEKGREWWKVLDEAKDVYNSCPHKIAGATPQELADGIDPFGKNISNKEKQTLIKNSIEKLDKARKEWYDRRNKQRVIREPLMIGEKVLVYNWSKKHAFNKKFDPEWLGPGVIKKQISKTIFQVKMPNGRFHIYHGDMLERFAQGSVT